MKGILTSAAILVLPTLAGLALYYTSATKAVEKGTAMYDGWIIDFGHGVDCSMKLGDYKHWGAAYLGVSEGKVNDSIHDVTDKLLKDSKKPWDPTQLRVVFLPGSHGGDFNYLFKTRASCEAFYAHGAARLPGQSD
jgi:hypothetical protein